MSRTYRRRGQRHEYRWVLRDWKWSNFVLERTMRNSPFSLGRGIDAT